MSGIKNNKGKLAVLVIYTLFIFLGPIGGFLPGASNTSSAYMQSLVPKNVDQQMRQFVTLTRQDQANKVFSMLSPEAQQVTSTSSIQAASAMLASTTDPMEIVGANIKHSVTSVGSSSSYDVVYEIQNNDPSYPYMLIEVLVEDQGTGPLILGIHGRPEATSIKTQGGFDFTQQGIQLIVAVLVQLFIIYTAYRYITKAQKPGWIFFLVILFVSLYFSVQWATETFNFNLGFASVLQKQGPSWAPWMVMIPVPLGAIYYWIRHKRYEEGQTSPIQIIS